METLKIKKLTKKQVKQVLITCIAIHLKREFDNGWTPKTKKEVANEVEDFLQAPYYRTQKYRFLETINFKKFVDEVIKACVNY